MRPANVTRTSIGTFDGKAGKGIHRAACKVDVSIEPIDQDLQQEEESVQIIFEGLLPAAKHRISVELPEHGINRLIEAIQDSQDNP